MKYILKIYAVVSFITFSILFIAGLAIFFLRGEPENDVPVLLNAGVEYGYDATIYVVREGFNGQLTVCGGAQVAPGVAVTAAHCVDNARRVLVGKEALDLQSGKNATVEDILIKTGWEGLEDGWELDIIVNDLALLAYNSAETRDTSTASIGTISLGCNYKVVGFGTKYGEGTIVLNSPRQKDSLDVCIVSFNENLVLVKPDSDQGFCFGDSGSPIYDKRNGELVANLSSTIGAVESDLCDLDNRVLAVRLDTNQSFISSASSQIDFEFQTENVIAQDATESSFSTELIDLIDRFEWNSQHFNLVEEDDFTNDSFNRTVQEINEGDDEPETTGNTRNSDNEAFSFSSFADITDEAFYGFFVVVGINLFLSSLLLLWTFRKPTRRQYVPPTPYQSI